MAPLTYHRPQSIEEALELLEAGVPLAGGTDIVPRRRQLRAVIDLQDLGLDKVEEVDGGYRIGAMVSLQRLLAIWEEGSPALASACRQEAALNMRNRATLAGLIGSGTGRSPLLCALLALNPTLHVEPAGEIRPLQEYLGEREGDPRSLVTSVAFARPTAMAYEAVARSPMDRPLVVAAAVRAANDGAGPAFRVALGGHGSAPLLLTAKSPEEADGLPAEASGAYAQAEDDWASGEYRSHVASTLVTRVLREVMG